MVRSVARTGFMESVQTRRLLMVSVAVLVLAVLFVVPSTVFSEEQARVSIESPRLGSPQAALPGGIIKILLSGVSSESDITIIIASPSSYYELKPSSVKSVDEGLVEVQAVLPENVKPGLYDIIVKIGDTTVTSERSLVVFEKWPEKLRIAHFTDIHSGVINDNGRTALSYFIAEVALAQLMGADVVVTTGDNVDVGGSLAQYKDLLAILRCLPIPTIMCPGNHEYTGDGTLSNWHRFVGPNYFYVRWGPYLFIMLDTGPQGRPPMAQLEWAEKVLKEDADAKVKILGFHHPLFNTKVVANITGSHEDVAKLAGRFYSSWAETLELAAKLLSLVDKYNVTLLLSGHVHADGIVLYNGKTWFVTTTAAGGSVRKGDYHGFRIIDLYANGTIRILPCHHCALFSEHAAISGENAFGTFEVSPNIIALTLDVRGVKELLEYAGHEASLGIRVPAGLLPSNASLHVMATCKVLNKTLYGNQHVKEARVTLVPTDKFSIRIILSPLEDKEPPTIKVYSIRPQKPVAGRDRVEVTVKVTDDAWGVSDVQILYRLPSGKEEKLSVYKIGDNYYRARLPVLNAPFVEIRVLASDVSGKTSDTGWIKVNYVTPTTTTQQTTTTQAPQQTTTSPQTETTQPQRAGGNTLVIVGVVVAVAVVAALLVVARKK